MSWGVVVDDGIDVIDGGCANVVSDDMAVSTDDTRGREIIKWSQNQEKKLRK
jgi:hypothetical protein